MDAQLRRELEAVEGLLQQVEVDLIRQSMQRGGGFPTPQENLHKAVEGLYRVVRRLADTPSGEGSVPDGAE